MTGIPEESLSEVVADIEEGATITVSACLRVGETKDGPPALFAFQFFDDSGDPVPEPVSGLKHSRIYGPYSYIHLSPAAEPQTVNVNVVVPAGASSLRVSICRWKARELRVVGEPTISTASERRPPLPPRIGAQEFPVTPVERLKLAASFEEKVPTRENLAVAVFEFSDKNGNPVVPREGFSSSSLFAAYKYLARRPTDPSTEASLMFQVPDQAVRVRIVIYAWKQKKLPSLEKLTLRPTYVPTDAIAYGRQAVDDRRGLIFSASIAYEGAVEQAVSLVGFRFFDAKGNPLAVDATGLGRSDLHKNYAYLSMEEKIEPHGCIEAVKKFVRPEGSAWIAWYIVPWKVDRAIVEKTPRLEQFNTQSLIGLEKLQDSNRFEGVGTDVANSLRDELSVSKAWGAVADVPPVPVGEAILEVQGGQWLQLRATVQPLQTREESELWLHATFWTGSIDEISADMPGFLSSREIGPYRPVTFMRPGSGEDFRINEAVWVPDGAEFAALLILQPDAEDQFEVHSVVVDPTDWDTASAQITPSEMGKDQLSALLDLATTMFDLPLAERATWALSMLEPANGDLAYAACWRKGQVQELDQRWLPLVPELPRYAPDTNTILHLLKVIYPDENSGGAVRSRNIVEGQAARGMRPVVVMPVEMHPFEPSQPDGPVEMGRGGVRICYTKLDAIDRRYAPHDSLLNLETSLHARIASRYRPSVIHASSGFRGYENALKGLALSRHFDVPFVYEVRSFHEQTWRPSEASGMSEQITRMRAAQENRCMCEADAVVTISEAMVENLADRGIEREKIFLVPNAIGPEFAEPADTKRTAELRKDNGFGEVPVVGYISNMSTREGHRVLVEAFARLRASFGPVRLLLVGEGAEFDAIHSLAEELGVGAELHMPGAVDHVDVKAWYALLDAMVVPRVADFASDYVTPLKPFEAMALGVPVLMSDRPVAAEITGREQERGLQFRTGDPIDLAERLETMLRDPDATHERTAAARNWVLEERSWEKVIARYDPVYDYARRRHVDRSTGKQKP